MVATVRCEEIAKEKISQLCSDEVLIHILTILSCISYILNEVMSRDKNGFCLGLVGIGGSCSIKFCTWFWKKAELNSRCLPFSVSPIACEL